VLKYIIAYLISIVCLKKRVTSPYKVLLLDS